MPEGKTKTKRKTQKHYTKQLQQDSKARLAQRSTLF